MKSEDTKNTALSLADMPTEIQTYIAQKLESRADRYTLASLNSKWRAIIFRIVCPKFCMKLDNKNFDVQTVVGILQSRKCGHS